MGKLDYRGMETKLKKDLKKVNMTAKELEKMSFEKPHYDEKLFNVRQRKIFKKMMKLRLPLVRELVKMRSLTKYKSEKKLKKQINLYNQKSLSVNEMAKFLGIYENFKIEPINYDILISDKTQITEYVEHNDETDVNVTNDNKSSLFNFDTATKIEKEITKNSIEDMIDGMLDNKLINKENANDLSNIPNHESGNDNLVNKDTDYVDFFSNLFESTNGKNDEKTNVSSSILFEENSVHNDINTNNKGSVLISKTDDEDTTHINSDKVIIEEDTSNITNKTQSVSEEDTSNITNKTQSVSEEDTSNITNNDQNINNENESFVDENKNLYESKHSEKIDINDIELLDIKPEGDNIDLEEITEIINDVKVKQNERILQASELENYDINATYDIEVEKVSSYDGEKSNINDIKFGFKNNVDNNEVMNNEIKSTSMSDIDSMIVSTQNIIKKMKKEPYNSFEDIDKSESDKTLELERKVMLLQREIELLKEKTNSYKNEVNTSTSNNYLINNEADVEKIKNEFGDINNKLKELALYISDYQINTRVKKQNEDEEQSVYDNLIQKYLYNNHE
ncbi:hypothetical protein [Spiroplasma endosymbiont of Aspidapion aeneum]|uniref:hypothetical protein n=1 Tax=Spiroplasma endosymbiont of Aspidapion aeneum TaxID=3066276 RepID=UPI00313B74B1